MQTTPNKAVNSDEFFDRCAHYKYAGYGWRYISELPMKSRHLTTT